jgi:hypothetical protein
MSKRDEDYPIASWAAAARGDLEHASMTSRDIERQEAAGTQAFAASDRLPLDGSSNPNDQQYLQALGFTLGDPIDDLFRHARLPQGWRKQPSPEDSRTTLLLDAQGRKRGYVWYKAAWYDQSAYMVLSRRYRKQVDQYKTPTRRQIGHDQATDAMLWHSAEYAREDYKASERYEQEANDWLDAHYPDWHSPVAYWDAPEDGQ